MLIVLLLISINVNAQNFHNIESGLDSLALVNNIKSQFATTIRIDSTIRDTVWTEKYDYLPNGFIKRYAETDIKNTDSTDLWKLGYHYIEFEYNQKGYLIDEKIHWNGPINIAEVPDSLNTTTNKVFKDGVLQKKTVTTTKWYDEEENHTYSIIYLYNPDGTLSVVDSLPYSRASYYYNDKGLKERIEYSNSIRLYRVRMFNYEFYVQ